MIWKKLIDIKKPSWDIQVGELDPCDLVGLVIFETSLPRYMRVSLVLPTIESITPYCNWFRIPYKIFHIFSVIFFSTAWTTTWTWTSLKFWPTWDSKGCLWFKPSHNTNLCTLSLSTTWSSLDSSKDKNLSSPIQVNSMHRILPLASAKFRFHQKYSLNTVTENAHTQCIDKWYAVLNPILYF